LSRAARASPVGAGGGVGVEQGDPDGGVAVGRAGGLAQPGVGDQPGVGFDHDVGFEAVLAAFAGLVGMAGIRVDDRDDPVRGDGARDAPAPVAPIGALGGFDVLTGDQRQQRHRLGLLGLEPLVPGVARFEPGQHRERVVDQHRDQLVTGLGVVPGDLGFARAGVVMPRGPGRDDLGGATDLAGDPADRGDQLGHGVLAGDRVIQDRRIQRPPGLARHRPALADDLADHLEDPLRAGRGRQAAPPIGQRRRVEPGVGDRQPARSLPAQIERERLDRFAVGEAVQGLQHQHRRDHLRWHARAAAAGREQIGEQLRREQPGPVGGQEPEHAARGDQMPRDRLHVQQLTLIIRASLHQMRIPSHQPRSSPDTPLNSAVS
jgi:hypothetical protein